MKLNSNYMVPCLLDPFPSVAIWAGIFVGIDVLQGAPIGPFLLRRWGIYTAGFWSYHAMICPMEAIHGRQSSLHNVASAGTLGYIGVSRGWTGIPFVNPYFAMRFRNPAILGALVYGGLGGAFGWLAGKPM